MASNAQSSKRTYWLVFLVTLVIMLGFLVIDPTWFWVPLPFVLTAFVKAIDYI